MSGWFVFGDFDTRTLDVDVYPDDIDKAPARDFKVIPAQGRNGNIIVDQERYPNVERSYWIVARQNFSTIYDSISMGLLPHGGYKRLTDSWNPDEFYTAYVSAPLRPVLSKDKRKGKLKVEFMRRPQRWLTAGEEHVGNTEFSTVTNPTAYSAYPKFVFHIYGTAKEVYSVPLVRVNGVVAAYLVSQDMTIGDALWEYHDEWLVADFEACSLYAMESKTDLTRYLSSASGKNKAPISMPALNPGANEVVEYSYTSNEYIIPRYYRL